MADAEAQIEYTPEQLARAQQLVEFDRAKKAAELTARRAAYRTATAALVATSEWATVRDGLAAIVSGNEADGLLSFHVAALVEIMGRLDKAVPAGSSG
ncbi:hypothetical protein [Sphingomonas sp. NFR15]|uniref:hypothetical protein n=1 Tax=Sphingomonas sp. NFR15 TaxID=1566282 RepID=UPI00087E66D5|nr:hypothetical protein [Sphingomonas sp. NFR15]SDA14890.1 hypothetical protein SAMN03159340_00609 [Sphingomonas sp. NFR15]